jgi:poly(3-hydroxybutyrate) depolymerase
MAAWLCATGRSWWSNGRVSAKHARSERNGPVTHDFYTDGAGSVRVESILVEGLAHAFPIRIDNPSSCGQPGHFVVAAEICATTEIARFWGLPTDK